MSEPAAMVTVLPKNFAVKKVNFQMQKKNKKRRQKLLFLLQENSFKQVTLPDGLEAEPHAAAQAGRAPIGQWKHVAHHLLSLHG